MCEEKGDVRAERASNHVKFLADYHHATVSAIRCTRPSATCYDQKKGTRLPARKLIYLNI
jgi:hypothetical protein